jgi:hypothetical protein
MVVTLPDALMVLYPAAVRGEDYRIENRDGTDQIVFWSSGLGPPPTQAALDGVTEAQVQAAADAQVSERRDLLQDAATALATNDAFPMTGTLTSAQINAQLRALTRQNSRIIRYLVRQIEGG